VKAQPLTRLRLDVLVAERTGTSRTRAQALIMAGKVHVEGALAQKPGALVPRGALIGVAQKDPYVSRGGRKLAWAIDRFAWLAPGLRCLDVGASTGGFTDCLLSYGAASVTAVDVGYGQLAWRLRQDPRVRAVERCNFRYAQPELLGPPFDFAVADVSFISLAKLAPNLALCLREGGRFIGLVKPQFEVGRGGVGKGGVVHDPSVHIEILSRVAQDLARCGLVPCRLTHSPLRGPAGNIEFLIGARKVQAALPFDPTGVVRRAHESLAR